MQFTRPIAQSIMCLTADPGVLSLIQARSHTFVEIDKIISTVFLPLPLIQEVLLAIDPFPIIGFYLYHVISADQFNNWTTSGI